MSFFFHVTCFCDFQRHINHKSNVEAVQTANAGLKDPESSDMTHLHRITAVYQSVRLLTD